MIVFAITSEHALVASDRTVNSETHTNEVYDTVKPSQKDKELKEVSCVVEGSNGEWVLWDEAGDILDPDRVVFNKRTGGFEAPPLEGVLTNREKYPDVIVRTLRSASEEED